MGDYTLNYLQTSWPPASFAEEGNTKQINQLREELAKQRALCAKLNKELIERQ